MLREGIEQVVFPEKMSSALGNVELLSRQGQLRDRLFACLSDGFHKAQREQVGVVDRMRDWGLHQMMRWEGIQRPPKRARRLLDVFSLALSTVLYGFDHTTDLLSRDSRVFDTEMGEMAAKAFLTRFIAGKSLQDAIGYMEKYRRAGIHATYALEIEGEVDPELQMRNLQQLLAQINQLSRLDAEDEDRNVSVKVTAWSSDFHESSEAFDRAYVGLEQLISAAFSGGVFVRIDMEEYCYRDATLALYLRLLKEHPDWAPHVGIVVQAYLADAYASTAFLLDQADELGVPVNIRLVKGAYMEKERAHALAEHRPDPICPSQAATNANYLRVAQLLSGRQESWGRLAFGTMNPKTVADVLMIMFESGISHERFEFQQLYGMVDPLSYALVDEGFRVRKYAPYADRYSKTSQYFNRRMKESPGQRQLVEHLLSSL